MKVGDKVQFIRSSMFYEKEKVNGEVVEINDKNKYKKILVKYNYWTHEYSHEIWFSRTELTLI